MTKRIRKAIDILLDAINNGTLAKGHCSHCAVGNLVSYGMHNPEFRDSAWRWSDLFVTIKGKQIINEDFLTDQRVLNCIIATDFTWRELAKIEYAFETNTKIHCNDYTKFSKGEIKQDQIRGLESAVRVMLEFDECKELIKEVFTDKVLV